MLSRPHVKIVLTVAITTIACLWATPARAQVQLRCNWGAPLAPAVWPASTQVMMTPTVADVGGLPSGTSKVVFVSFGATTGTATLNQINRDGGGVLRIIDLNCNEIARYPAPGSPAPPANCPSTLNTVPDLAPASGLAVGNIDLTPDVEIVGVIGGPTSNHRQIVAFTLVGTTLIPKWCSAANALPAGDFIAGPSAPAIAQLDQAGMFPFGDLPEIVIDNKVFTGFGGLRYTGFNHNGNCAVGVSGGGPCPRSRTPAVANVFGFPVSQIVTGRGIYRSPPGIWMGTLGWVNSNVSMLAPPLLYPAVAELDPNSVGPEIVVTDTMANALRVLSSATGIQLASAVIPNVPGCPGSTVGPSCPCPGASCPKCGGPPMIGNADGVIGQEIGVASCNRYSMFRYTPGGGLSTLSVLWSVVTTDPGGQTTSVLRNAASGARIYYADMNRLHVLNGANGTPLQTALAHTSATAIEGPVIAAFETGPAKGRLVLASNNYLWGSGERGIRIFEDPSIGPVRSVWNQHSYHVTNVTNSFGVIPVVEPPSWLAPAHNTYRVQQ